MLSPIPNTLDPKAFNEFAPMESRFMCIVDGRDFDVKMQYPQLKLKNAVADCYVREEVAERLKAAQNFLPDGYRLRIWDAWRPFALQEELYQKYSADIIKQFGLQNESYEKKQKIIESYISYPVRDEREPAVHTTGGAVDVTLIDKYGNELEMGTDFDAFGEKTKTDYFETHNGNTTIRDNRRLLYSVMIRAGFTNLPSEWWHYDYGDKFWGYYKNIPALYSGVFKENELKIK